MISLHLEALRLCWAIEKLSASPEQTALSIQASKLAQRIYNLGKDHFHSSDEEIQKNDP